MVVLLGALPFDGHGLDELGGYASFYPPRYGELLNITQGLPTETLSRWSMMTRFDSPLLSLMNMKYVATPPADDWNGVLNLTTK